MHLTGDGGPSLVNAIPMQGPAPQRGWPMKALAIWLIDASAIDPKLTPHSLKNHRRVTSLRASSLI